MEIKIGLTLTFVTPITQKDVSGNTISFKTASLVIKEIRALTDMEKYKSSSMLYKDRASYEDSYPNIICDSSYTDAIFNTSEILSVPSGTFYDNAYNVLYNRLIEHDNIESIEYVTKEI